MVKNFRFDVIVLGAGAAGLMCAIEAGKRGRSVLVLDHAKKPAEKIRISGGGRCNFTNLHCGPKNFLSSNPHFCKSVLSQYDQQDFVSLVERHKIAYHEKTLGQLFCDGSAREIIDMLLSLLKASGGALWLQTSINRVEKSAHGFRLETTAGLLHCKSLVVATGGKSIPKMGATGFGYELAVQFGLDIIEPRPALVPFTYSSDRAEKWGQLTGVAIDIEARIDNVAFREAMLITHRGLSGPAILQISSYWREGATVMLNMAPEQDISAYLKSERTLRPKSGVAAVLETVMPKRFSQQVSSELGLDEQRIADLSNKRLEQCGAFINQHEFTPGGTEGYRTAEVTLGGVNTDALSQKTLESKDVPGLFFIGEVVDVTGHLGGHNFQWAWSSGFAAGQVV